MHVDASFDSAAMGELRKRLADQVRSIVLKAELPVRLPALAQSLQREIPGLREGQGDGAGSFGNLMRQLNMADFGQESERKSGANPKNACLINTPLGEP